MLFFHQVSVNSLDKAGSTPLHWATLLRSLSWSSANQSLLLLLNAACLAKKQQIPNSILYIKLTNETPDLWCAFYSKLTFYIHCNKRSLWDACSKSFSFNSLLMSHLKLYSEVIYIKPTRNNLNDWWNPRLQKVYGNFNTIWNQTHVIGVRGRRSPRRILRI
jgi:hypothetical protein